MLKYFEPHQTACSSHLCWLDESNNRKKGAALIHFHRKQTEYQLRFRNDVFLKFKATICRFLVFLLLSLVLDVRRRHLKRYYYRHLARGSSVKLTVYVE